MTTQSDHPELGAWLERAEMGPWSVAMTARPIPRRHWRSYGDAPLPSGTEFGEEKVKNETGPMREIAQGSR